MLDTISNRIGLLGQVAIDYFLSANAWVESAGERLALIHAGDLTFPIEVKSEAFAGAKVVAPYLPSSLFALATEFRRGGGALNTMLALGLISPATPIFYLESSSRYEFPEGHLGVSAGFLSLHPAPKNIVVAGKADRIIFKSPVPAVDDIVLNDDQEKLISTLAGCRAVLIQSSKHPSVVRRVIAACARAGTPVAAVVTPSLPSGFVVETLLPAARIVCASSDELKFLGLPGCGSPERTYFTISRLHSWAREAYVFVTMGRDGCIVIDPSGHAYMVKLRHAISEHVQAIITANPSRKVGAGDAFAAGVMAFMTSSQAKCQSDLPVAVRAAVSGSSAALRWMKCVNYAVAADFQIAHINTLWSDYDVLQKPAKKARRATAGASPRQVNRTAA